MGLCCGDGPIKLSPFTSNTANHEKIKCTMDYSLVILHDMHAYVRMYQGKMQSQSNSEGAS